MLGRVVVSNGPQTPFEIREYPVADPGPEEILVKITIASVCGSDLHMWRGETPPFQRPPGVPGHEMTGVVAKLGRNRKTDTLGRPLKAGDRVAFAYFIPCGACWACLTGTTGCPNRYRSRSALTVEDPPHFHGAYGDYYYLLPRQWVYLVPDELSDELVAPVNCALSQVIYGLNRIGIWLGDTVVIQGAGGLGINAIAVARDMGAGIIIAVDGIPERLELARAFGADATINMRELPTRADRVARVKELTGGGRRGRLRRGGWGRSGRARRARVLANWRPLPDDGKHRTRSSGRDRPPRRRPAAKNTSGGAGLRRLGHSSRPRLAGPFPRALPIRPLSRGALPPRADRSGFSPGRLGRQSRPGAAGNHHAVAG